VKPSMSVNSYDIIRVKVLLVASTYYAKKTEINSV